jgi:hypothetical protein
MANSTVLGPAAAGTTPQAPQTAPTVAPAPAPIVNTVPQAAPAPVAVVSTPKKHPILMALDIAGTVAVIILAVNVVHGWLTPKPKGKAREEAQEEGGQ